VTNLHASGAIQGVGYAGIGRLMRPTLKNFPHPEATGFYQPIYASILGNRELCHSEYVLRNSYDVTHGIGGVFQQQGGTVTRRTGLKSRNWIPRKVISTDEAFKRANSFVYNHQLRDLEQALRLGPQEQKETWRLALSGSSRALKALEGRLKNVEFLSI
jgi:hypothetical protein